MLSAQELTLLAEIRDAMLTLAQELRNLNPDGHLPAKCREKKCSYFTHYLAFGPPDLTHDGFHAAEVKCEEAQKRASEWYEAHEHKPLPAALDQLCREWETRVRV